MSKKMSVYLAGPINACGDEEAHGWRHRAASRLVDTQGGGFGAEDPGITVLDPMRRDFRGCEAGNEQAIVDADLADICGSTHVLASCERPSWGTAMEIRYAHGIGRPVIGFLPLDRPVSPWLRYHTALLVPTMDDAVDHLLAARLERPCWYVFEMYRGRRLGEYTDLGGARVAALRSLVPDEAGCVVLVGEAGSRTHIISDLEDAACGGLHRVAIGTR